MGFCSIDLSRCTLPDTASIGCSNCEVNRRDGVSLSFFSENSKLPAHREFSKSLFDPTDATEDRLGKIQEVCGFKDVHVHALCQPAYVRWRKESCVLIYWAAPYYRARYWIPWIVFNDTKQATRLEGSPDGLSQERSFGKRNVMVHTDGCDKVEGLIREREIVHRHLSLNVYRFTRCNHPCRWITAGCTCKITVRQPE